MKLGSSSFLGLALGERTVACAQVTGQGDRRAVSRTAVFQLPAALTAETASTSGSALAQFLRREGFSASRAVAGVPARWLIAAEREVPPSSGEQAAAILRLQAERLAASQSGDMAFDYVGEPDPKAPSKVLLVGMQRRRLEAVRAFLDAAGLDVLAVTASSMALARATGQDKGDAPMLVLAGGGAAEVVIRHGGRPRMIRHLAAGVALAGGDGEAAAPAVGALGAEVRRAVVLTPLNGEGPAREVVLWDGAGLSQDDRADLAARLGLPIREGDAAEHGRVPPGPFAAAAAMAMAAVGRERLPLDFAHSRLTPPPVRRIGRRTLWATVAGVVAVALLASLYVTVHRGRAKLAGLDAEIGEKKNDVKKATEEVARINFGLGYFEGQRSPVLGCLNELTASLRDDERLYVTNLTFRETRKGTLGGKSPDQRLVLALLDRMTKNPKFADVKLIGMTPAGGQSREVSFSISFAYLGND